MRNILVFFMFSIGLLTLTTPSWASDTNNDKVAKRAREEGKVNDENTDPRLEKMVKNKAYLPLEITSVVAGEYFAQKNYTRASDLYAQFLPADILIKRKALMAYVRAKHFERAAQLYQEISLDSISDLRDELMINLRAHQHGQAISIGRLIVSSPHNRLQDRINLASAYFSNKDFNQAREIYRAIPAQAINGNDNKARAVCSSIIDGDLDRAKMLCQLIIEDTKHTLEDERWVAERYVLMKDYQNACIIYESILQKNSSIKDLLHAAKYNFLNGNLKRAHEIAEIILLHSKCTPKIRKYISENQKKFPII